LKFDGNLGVIELHSVYTQNINFYILLFSTGAG